MLVPDFLRASIFGGEEDRDDVEEWLKDNGYLRGLVEILTADGMAVQGQRCDELFSGQYST